MLNTAISFYAASYSIQFSGSKHNKLLRTICSNISNKCPMKPEEMNLLLLMIYKIILKHEHCSGNELDFSKWERKRVTYKDNNGNEKSMCIYPTTRGTKLWNHFIIYAKIQVNPTMQESQRKIFFYNFASSITVIQALPAGYTDEVPKFVCYGPGVDALKKTCGKRTTFKTTWNCVLHLGHKHGIVYVCVFLFFCICICICICIYIDISI